MGDARRGSVSRLFTTQFTVAVMLLATAALLAGPVAKRLQIKQAKRALPLQKPLGTINTVALAPYHVWHRRTLDPVIIDALGTDRYLSCTLEDTSAPRGDPLRYANLFVTYYSGGGHLVPHTPDVCYLGAGYAPAQPHETGVGARPAVQGVYSEICPD